MRLRPSYVPFHGAAEQLGTQGSHSLDSEGRASHSTEPCREPKQLVARDTQGASAPEDRKTPRNSHGAHAGGRSMSLEVAQLFLGQEQGRAGHHSWGGGLGMKAGRPRAFAVGPMAR